MARNQQKKKPYGTMAIMGILSIALYITLLMQQDIITRYFALGGVYAFLPIITAFLFSYIHGNFTGSFWTVLGIEAAKRKKEVK
jgi:hypothetical protein